MSDRIRLGEALVKAGKLTHEKLNLALNMQRRTKERLGEVLVQLRFVSEADVAHVVASQYGCPFVAPTQVVLENIDREALEKLGFGFARERNILPLRIDGKLRLVVSDILATNTTDRAQRILKSVPLAVSNRTAINLALEVLAFEQKDADRLAESAREGIASGEINELVGYIIGRAVLAGASDIHIEPAGLSSVVRYRIDGVLHAELTIPRERHENLLNVLYGKAGVELSDFMRFHDGRFSFQFAGRSFDVRFSSSPTVEGPFAVLRILSDDRSLRALGDLGFDDQVLRSIGDLVRLPHGVLLVVGPTGSGKTTTLYALLTALQSGQNKILTVEDPVEIRLPSVQQVQVNEKAGVTFASAVRAFLRHDPDIIMIGEIRDAATAQEAARAANTGHLVLSTVHANSAVEVIARLVDLGISPHMVASTVVGVISQRFVRKLCSSCAVPSHLAAGTDVRAQFGSRELEPGTGCVSCRGRGYEGRHVVGEVLSFDSEIRKLVHHNAPLEEISARAVADGFRSIRDCANRLIGIGATSRAEVERVLGPDPNASAGHEHLFLDDMTRPGDHR